MAVLLVPMGPLCHGAKFELALDRGKLSKLLRDPLLRCANVVFVAVCENATLVRKVPPPDSSLLFSVLVEKFEIMLYTFFNFFQEKHI